MRRAVVQVSKEEAKGGADQQASSKTKAPSDAIQTVAADFAGFGVAPKKGGVFALDKDVFWFAKQSKDRFRWNMLNPFPLLRQVRVSRAQHSTTTAQPQHVLGGAEAGVVSKMQQWAAGLLRGACVSCDLTAACA